MEPAGKDPLVEDARNAGQSYVDSFGGDLARLMSDIRERAAKSGHEVLHLSPKLLDPTPIAPAKKVG